MSKNKNLHKAREARDGEFYTRLSDIEKELKYYHRYFEDKVIYCNADGDHSNFVKYFKDNKTRLGIKKVINSSFDFRSEESIELLQQADIVVSNPPFSLFGVYVEQLIRYNKEFVIIGPKNAIPYKAIFHLIKDNRLWLGIGMPSKFLRPDNSIKDAPAYWYTNLDHSKRNADIKLTKEYDAKDYPEYDNYTAINVDRVVNIPKDYTGALGVPISFLTKYSPSQFEVLGITGRKNLTGLKTKLYTKEDAKNYSDLNSGGVLIKDGEYKIIFTRLLIIKISA